MRSFRYFPRHAGFTLIEIMIAVVIVAILAAVALPSYQQHVVRSHRTAAQGEMLNIASLQQQYFLANRSYASKSDLEGNGYTLPSEVASKYDYDIALAASGPPAFTITFTPRGSQASDGAITLNSAGQKTPAGKW